MRLPYLGVFVLTATVACEKPVPKAETPLRPVRYMEVLSASGGRARSFPAVAKAGVEAQLSFRVPGTINEVDVKVGDRVSKGQIIAKLDDSDFRLQVQAALADLSQAQAQERNARAAYDRSRKLYESNNVSKSQLDSSRAQAESDRAQVNAAFKQLEIARRQLAYTKLSAPADGAIATVKAEVNENVSNGQTIVMLTGGSKLEVSVAVPEVLISLVEHGMPATVTFDAVKAEAFKGKVTEVGVASGQGGPTFPVTVELEKRSEQLRSGMAADVTFQFTKSGPEVILVPPFSVRSDQKGTFVFVVEKTGEKVGRVTRKPVKAGELSDQGIAILEGLGDGELLVTAGVSRIQDGQQVKLLDRHKQN